MPSGSLGVDLLQLLRAMPGVQLVSQMCMPTACRASLACQALQKDARAG